MSERPVALLRMVVAGDVGAWHHFVESYAGFLYSLAWRYARGDVDRASELVVVALEGLRKPDTEGRPCYRLRRYLESLAEFKRRSRFVTWLALVVKNLFRDWFREHEGRRLLPKEIGSLDSMDQEVFKLVFWEGLSEDAAFDRLASEHGLAAEEYQQRLDRVIGKLSDQNLYNIYLELLKRQPALRLGGQPAGERSDSRRAGLDVADPRPYIRPDRAFEMAEDLAVADLVGRALQEAVAKLPPVSRNVLMLHAVQGMSGDEIRRIMGFRKRQRVYDELAKARRHIGRILRAEGIDRRQARRAVGHLNDLLSEKNGESGSDPRGSSVVKKRQPRKPSRGGGR